MTVWFQVTLINNSSSEVAEQVHSNEIPCHRHRLKYRCVSGSVSFLQRCVYPQETPSPSRVFFRALHSHWNRHGVGTPGYPSDLSSYIRNLYLSEEKAWTWQPSPLCTGVLCRHRNPLAPELQSNLTSSMPFILFSDATLSFLESLFFNIFPRDSSLSQDSPTVQSWAKPLFSGFLRTVTLILRSSLNSQNEGESYIRKV